MAVVPQGTTFNKWLRRVERLAIVALLISLGVFRHLYTVEKDAREVSQEALAKLPANILARYIIQNRTLTAQVRDAKGKVVQKVIYIPDEGKVEVVTKEKDVLQQKYDELTKKIIAAKTPSEIETLKEQLNGVVQDINNNTTIQVRDWGLTSRFGFGLVAGPGVKSSLRTTSGRNLDVPIAPMLDWKYAYFHRYSATLQINPIFVGPGFSRHIDDITPNILHLNNLEWGLSGGPGWTGGHYVGTFVRTNF